MSMIKIDTSTTKQIGPILDTDLNPVTDPNELVFKLAKNTGSFSDVSTAITPSSSGSGYFSVTFALGHVDTLGDLYLAVESAGTSTVIIPYVKTFQVVTSSYWNMVYNTGISVPTKEQIADQVWDELMTGHVTIGSMAEYLSSILSYADNLPSNPASVSDIPTTTAITGAIWGNNLSSYVIDTTSAAYKLYYASSYSDPDKIMLQEAKRQGYRSGIDVIVEYADTEAGLGTNLKSAYATAKARKPYGSDLSATNRVTVFLPKWKYDVGATGLELDTNYVDLIALDPECGGNRQYDDLDKYDGTTSLESFRPPSTLVYTSTDGVTTVSQAAQYVRFKGFGIAQLSGDTSSTYHAYYASVSTNAGSQYDQMYFWHKAPSSTRFPVGFYQHCDGTWRDCIANAYAWRLGRTTTTGQFSADMRRCVGGCSSFIGDYSDAVGEGTHKATGSDLRRCQAVGAYEINSYTWRGRAFAGCSYFGVDVDSTCYFEECEAEERSFGIGETNEGTYVRCRGGDYCFGATTSTNAPVHVGEFAGTAIDCIGGKGSFGGTYADAASPGKCSGTLVRCLAENNELPLRIEGATLIEVILTTTETNQDCITLLDSTSKVYNCTLLPYEGGTGIPINAASALNISASGNNYGNVSAAANGLGSNVTNLGTIDVVPKVTTVTGAVTTDSTSRDASKADVSSLATSTALAAAKSVIDAVNVKTTNLPSQPAAQSDIPSASANAEAVDTKLSASHGSDAWSTADVSTIPTLLTGRSITVVSPVTTEQNITLVAGDDYDSDNDRALQWTNSGGDWCSEDLTDAIVTLYLQQPNGTEVVSVTGTVVTPTGTQTIKVELTAAQTALFTNKGGKYKYLLKAVKSGLTETLVTGDVYISA